LHNFLAVENRKIKTINEKMHQFITKLHTQLLALFILLAYLMQTPRKSRSSI